MLLKEMSLRFVFGYTPPEFAEAAQMIATGGSQLAALVTGSGNLDEVTAVFDSLTGGGQHVKVLIRP